MFGYATDCRWRPVFYIVRTVESIQIYEEYQDEDAINASFDDPKLIEMERITLYPYSEIGPVKGLFEFYKRESFLSSPDDYRWQFLDMNLSKSEIDFVHQELIDFAESDRKLSQHQPGAPARMEFLPGATLFSLTKVGTFFGLPALITWLIGYFKTHTQEAIANTRRSAGLCIHCTYDCQDLPSPTCPECGQPHTINPEA